MNAANWEVRRTAAFLLREFGGAEGLKELQPLLTDTEPLVQREAIQALVLNGTDAASQILLQALTTTTGRPRETLITELSSMRDERAAPLFCYLVRHLDRKALPRRLRRRDRSARIVRRTGRGRGAEGRAPARRLAGAAADAAHARGRGAGPAPHRQRPPPSTALREASSSRAARRARGRESGTEETRMSA